MLTLLSMGFLVSCLPDKRVQTGTVSNNAAQAESHRKFSDTPKFNQVEVDVKIPQKDEWQLMDSFSIKGFNPTGITYRDSIIFVTDTTQNLVVSVDINSHELSVISNNYKVVYISQSNRRILMPLFEKDSLIVLLNKDNQYYIPFEIPLSNPTSAYGLRIDNVAIVDGNNNRIIRSYHGQTSIIGGPGSGAGEFYGLTSIHMVNDKIYVADSGNARIQVFSMEGEFQFSFGQQDGLIEPTGLTSGLDMIFVSDRVTKQIYLYNYNGELIYKLNKIANSPVDICFFSDRLIIADKVGATYKVYTYN